MNDELTGKVVLVHPGLPCDPLAKQNQIGVICEANVENDDVFVDFKDKIGLYGSDALLVFRDGEEIHRNLAALAYETPFAELKAITQIDLFLRYGGDNKELMAMEIARDNPAVQRFCLEPLNDQLSKDLSKNYGRDG